MNDPTRLSDPDGKFNLKDTATLAGLFKVAYDQRDEAWFEKFAVAALNATMTTPNPQTGTGPDGFPYFQLRIPETGKAVEPYCLSHILDHCCNLGVGVVMFPEKGMEPGFILSLGLVGCLKHFKRWEYERIRPGTATEVVEEEREVLTGAPDDNYYPQFMWPHLGNFMRGALKHPNPKIGLMVDAKNVPTRSLVVNIRYADVGNEEQLNQIGRALQWFLMPGQPLMFLPDEMSDDWMAPLP